MVFIVVVMVVSSIGGFVAQQYLARRAVGPEINHEEFLPVYELVIPVRTLAGLLLAFVLFAVYSSYTTAAEQAANEAGAVLSMGEAAVILQPSGRDPVIGSLQCYARSVIGPDWDAQTTPGQRSPVTDAAADHISVTLSAANADARNRTVIPAILADDGDRIEARIRRVDQGSPAVPGELWALLLITMVLTTGGLAALGHPRVRTWTQIAVLAGTTVVIGLTLLVIYDLDRPYDGPARVALSAMEHVEQRLAQLPGGDESPPCDAEGRLTGAATG